ncbi:MAG: NAD-dependent epimerase/dehydratase family protein [Clostridia bacterium]|nr:NAD-dependent epimerase/dehydratase family protein [Clostridia bacterium]
MKKILILGGTGAMGVYLVPELLSMGYAVDVVSLDAVESDNSNLRYIQTANAKDMTFLAELLKNDYNGIVDFLIYNTADFEAHHRLLLEHTDHYIYLSSYRVYANEEHPIVETSPRLLDVSKDEEFRPVEDYSLYKARGEDILKASSFSNWTAIRPAITYSKRRFQLVTLEANVVVNRALAGKTVVLPKEAMGVQATMSWGGDVAKMIARLLLNKAACRDVFTVATSEHNTWETVAGYYRELVGLNYITVDKEDYLSILDPNEQPGRRFARWQLDYDRLFDRIVDNSKILNITGLKQSELSSLYDGLKRELSALPKGIFFPGSEAVNQRMDAYLENH